MKVVSYLIFMEYTMLRSTQGQVIEFVAKKSHLLWSQMIG